MLGSYWSLLNLYRHDAFDGGLAERADQIPEHSLREIVTTVRRLGLQLLDLSGSRGRDVAVYVVAGLVLFAASLVGGAGDNMAVRCSMPRRSSAVCRSR